MERGLRVQPGSSRPEAAGSSPRHDISSDDLHAKTVFSDIIIHHRNTDDNFVVIEVKKSSSLEGDEWDMTKLAAFKRQLVYKIAMFVRFRTDSEDVGFEYNILRAE